MSNVGAITYEDVGLSPDETNMLVDGLLSIGLDIRVQGARLGSPTIDEATNETVYPGMTFFPMQFQPYVTVTPADGLTIYGTYLPGPDSFKEDNGACDPVFAGMACYEGYVMYEPESTWPTVRAGVFQPAIGIRHDDHTMLIRWGRQRPPTSNHRTQLCRARHRGHHPAGHVVPRGSRRVTSPQASTTRSMKGPRLPTSPRWPTTYGSHLRLTSQYRLRSKPKTMALATLMISVTSPRPRTTSSTPGLEPVPTGAATFELASGFMGLGIHEGVSFVAETSYSQRTIDYTTLNHLVGLWYTPIEWLSTAIRYEYATTTLANDRMAKTQALVAGLEFFPTPYMEVRPEYRLVETDAYRFGHATVQIHLFY